MNLEAMELDSIFHPHTLKRVNNQVSICDICSRNLGNEIHFTCKDCDFDICFDCLLEKNTSSKAIKSLLNAVQNTEESQEMINFIRQRLDIQFTSPSLEGSLVRSYPTFYLFEEQDQKEGYLLEATRNYLDEKGNIVYFFSSSKSRKLIPICKRCCDSYFDSHSWSIKMNQYYPNLRLLMEPDTDFANVESYFREGASAFMFGATFGIAAGIDYLFFSPKFNNIYSGYYLFNAFKLASEKRFGVLALLTDDFHIKPHTQGEKCIKFTIDHFMSIDWSTIESIPIIISILNQIKRLYQNLLNEGNQTILNILFSLADDLQEGISVMKQNPLFSKQDDKRLIAFADSSIKSLQIFLRLKTNPLTILNTTVLNVYQADLGREFHAFLTSDQIQGFVVHLVNDIRENLTSRSKFGEVVNLDLNDPKPVFVILYSYITDSEVKLAKFIQEACEKIKGYCSKIKDQFYSLCMSHFASIRQILNSNKEDQTSNLKTISEFNQSHKEKLGNLLTEAINKKIIPDFYSIELSRMQNEIAQLNHLVKLVRLACEMERRKNDNIGLFNIDLAIRPCKESVNDYNIHIII